MKSNKWLLSLAVGFLCCGSAYAQTTVKGKITSESGEPLIGATITVKNSTDGTVTDIDGNYSLKTKKTLSSKDLLLFSYVGYKTLQKNYTGNTMNVKLAEESQQLNDVVVTALGIKREEKGLGYATETVKGDKITSALPSNWSTALNGEEKGSRIERYLFRRSAQFEPHLPAGRRLAESERERCISGSGRCTDE